MAFLLTAFFCPLPRAQALWPLRHAPPRLPFSLPQTAGRDDLPHHPALTGARPLTEPAPARPWEGLSLVSLPARELLELAGAPCSQLRLFAYKDGFVPVPFQIDELDRTGQPFLPEGPAGRPGDGLFRGGDSLLFPVWALASPAPPQASPPCGGVTEVKVARGTQKAWTGQVYLARCPAETPRAPGLIRYFPEQDRVEAKAYQLAWAKAQPLTPGSLRFWPAAGGTGQNILSGLYVEGQAQLVGGLVKVTRTLPDFNATIGAYKSGPLRITRQTPARARTLGTHYTNPGTFRITSILEAGRLRFEVVLDTGFDLSVILHDLVMTVAWEFQAFAGMTVQPPGRNGVGRVDGRLAEEERRFATLDAPWIYVNGPQGTFVGSLTYASRLPISRRIFYVEPGKGQLRLGFRLSHLEDIPAGQAVFVAEIRPLPGASLEQARALLEAEALPWRRVR